MTGALSGFSASESALTAHVDGSILPSPKKRGGGMKFSCLQENLSQGLSIVGRAVATRTTLPITQNVLISTDNSRLKLAATNLEVAISTWVGAPD